MPQTSGMDVLKFAKERNAEIPVILITAYGSIKQAIDALKAGALDYVVKPFDVEELKILVARGLEKLHLKEENILLKRDLKDRYGFEKMVGKSRTMQEIYTLIEKVAATDSTVLITGESGTGKEMAARAVHAQSPRRDGQFVSINCAALPENLLESELFGHTRGSFTGAVSDKKGMFEAATRGTLFLDEVGEMSPWTQVKLLRAIQERVVRRVGGNDEIPIDVRIIAATNQDLKKRIEEGKFREELFYRLNVISFEMPPLRKADRGHPYAHRPLPREVLREACEAHEADDPGRLRPPGSLPLARGISGSSRTSSSASSPSRTGRPSRPRASPWRSSPPRGKEEAPVLFRPGFDLSAFIDDLTKKYVNQALLATAGNLRQAAPLLGISYRTLRYLIDKFELKNVRKEERANGERRPEGGIQVNDIYWHDMTNNVAIIIRKEPQAYVFCLLSTNSMRGQYGTQLLLIL